MTEDLFSRYEPTYPINYKPEPVPTIRMTDEDYKLLPQKTDHLYIDFNRIPMAPNKREELLKKLHSKYKR